MKPPRVVALERDALPLIELKNPSGDIIKEITVMGDGHHSALELPEEPLQPCHTLRIEMVRGLVEQKDVRIGEEQAADGHAPPLTAAQRRDLCISRRAAEGLHGPVQLAVELPAIAGIDARLQLVHLLEQRVHVCIRVRHPGTHLLELRQHRLRVRQSGLQALDHGLALELGLLLKVADPHGVVDGELAKEVLVFTGKDAHDRAFPRTVCAQNADLRTQVHAQADILEDRLSIRSVLVNVSELEDHVPGLMRVSRSFRDLRGLVARVRSAALPPLLAPLSSFASS
mmetsp:Transcript_57913/g.169309  ORF Transcript_57913/g.169309 Transcript_57913/m.169309 type:complete len:285 (+) Transcript_57913:1262-2116(+)